MPRSFMLFSPFTRCKPFSLAENAFVYICIACGCLQCDTIFEGDQYIPLISNNNQLFHKNFTLFCLNAYQTTLVSSGSNSVICHNFGHLDYHTGSWWWVGPVCFKQLCYLFLSINLFVLAKSSRHSCLTESLLNFYLNHISVIGLFTLISALNLSPTIQSLWSLYMW